LRDSGKLRFESFFTKAPLLSNNIFLGVLRRVCLINPQLYLSTDSKISLLQENIARMSDEVAMECIRLGTDLPTVDGMYTSVCFHLDFAV
jgi:hypothetical protein